MNRISLYILFILIYLGLTKSFSISETGTVYIKNRFYFPSIFSGAPVTVMLTDYYSAGLFIKTYFHKYRVIRGINRPQVVIVRVSSDFYKENIKNIGMSLFRRSGAANMESSLPMPPGTVYLDDTAYGTWIVKSGIKQWEFYRAYKNIPENLLWGDFRPSKPFYNRLKHDYEEQNIPYYGETHEFGTDGHVTKHAKLKPSIVHRKEKIEWIPFFENYIKKLSSKDGNSE